MSFTAIRMELEGLVFAEISQKEKNTGWSQLYERCRENKPRDKKSLKPSTELKQSQRWGGGKIRRDGHKGGGRTLG